MHAPWASLETCSVGPLFGKSVTIYPRSAPAVSDKTQKAFRKIRGVATFYFSFN